MQQMNMVGAALVSLVLHGLLALGLLLNWQPQAAAPAARTVLQAQLYQPPVPASTVPELEPMPHQQQPQQQPASQTKAALQQAELARQRIEQEQQRKQELRKQREQQRQQQLARDRQEQLHKEQLRKEKVQQERVRQQQAQLAAARAAEAERLAAARWAENNHGYAPLQKSTPDYPGGALARGIEGDCTVEYTVTHAGTVADPRVVGQCHPLFIQPSLRAAQAFLYQPQMVNGQPRAVDGVRNTFHYRIEP